MAQRIIGLDIGSYALKIAVLESTVRSFRLSAFRVIRLAGGGEQAPDDAASAVQGALRQWRTADGGALDAILCGFPGDRAMCRFLELPFRDRKRIADTIGFQLESQLPVDLASIVYDYEVLRQDEGAARLMAVAADQGALRAFLDELAGAGVDPKVVSYGPAAYANLARLLPAGETEDLAIVDVGHRRTSVCVVRAGRPDAVRTVLRGGAAVTAALRDARNIPWQDAEELKHAAAGMPGFCLDEGLARLTAEALQPLLRDVRLALHAYQATAQRPLARVYLCGGSARLPGLGAALEQQTGIRVEPLMLARGGLPGAALSDEAAPVAPLSVALALRGVGGRAAASLLNLRQGPFAFRGEYQFLREKVRYFGLILLLVALVTGTRALLNHQAAADEYEALQAELAAVTKQVFGKESPSFDAALTTLRAGPEKSEGSLLPETTAFQLFFDITTFAQEVKDTPPPEGMKAAVPKTGDEAAAGGDGVKPPGDDEKAGAAAGGPDGPSDVPKDTPGDEGGADGGGAPQGFQLEFESVSIDKKTGTIKGEANSVEAYEAFYQKLASHPCLQKVQTTERKRVTFKRHEGWQKFQVKFTVECAARKPTKKVEAAGTPEKRPAETPESEGK